MKSDTRKAIRIINAQNTIDKQIKALKYNEYDNRHKIELLENKSLEYELRLQSLAKLISEEEFNENLANIMCCEYQDFNN